MGRRLLPFSLVLEVEEERLVRAVDSLDDILDRLGIQLVPVSKPLHALQFCYEHFDTVGGGILLGHFVVPPMEGDAPVPNLGGEVDTLLQIFELSALVQLKLVCLYEGVQNPHLQEWIYLKYGCGLSSHGQRPWDDRP